MNRISTFLTWGLFALAGMSTPAGYGQNYYTFSTIAGGGATNFANGAGTNAYFNVPCGVAVDGAGDVYVADRNNNVIREIAPQGTNWVVTTIAGQPASSGTNDGVGANAQFSAPTGIALDSATNLYVADQFNFTIRKMTRSGTNWTVSTLAGQPGIFGTNDGANDAAQFHNPVAITVDSATNLFVADQFNNAIREITPVGTNWVVATIAGGTNGSADGIGANARFYFPAGITVDANDRVFVADEINNLIRMVTNNGSSWGVTTIAGQLSVGAQNGLDRLAAFDQPIGLALDANGNIFVADSGNNDIRQMTPSGTNWLTSTIAGGSEGPTNGTGTNAQFHVPFGIAVDANDNVFVGDSQNNAIRLGVSGPGTLPPGNLTVAITPETAVTAGAEWQVNGVTFQTNGATVTNLPPGTYTITFNNVSGFTTPASQTVTVTEYQTTTAAANYAAGIPNAGSLEVVISPAAAVVAGAEWQVDGGALQTNGAIFPGLSIGDHTVTFTSVSGYSAPESQLVVITNGDTTLATATYSTNLSDYTLTVNSTLGGAATGGGSFVSGSPQTVTAVPASGYEFIAWTRDASGTSNPLTVSMTGNLTITANFAAIGSATLIVVTNGDGTVTPNENNKTLKLNHKYTLTATARPNNVFLNWTGSITTNKNPLSITLTGPMALQANFITNPFLPVKGVYNGLFYTANVTEQTAGMIKGFTVNQNGAYSGTIMFNGSGHGISGKFSLGGQATNKISRPNSQGGSMEVLLTIDLNSASPQLTGIVFGTNNGVLWIANLLADMADDTLPSAEYTLLLGPDTNNAPPVNSPGGDGYALITNNAKTPASGKVEITGALADGTAVNQTVPVSSDGYFPMYANLYGGKGLLLGWINLTLTNTTGVGLTWIHPARASGLYRAGFTNILLASQIMLSPWSNDQPVLDLLTNLSLSPFIDDIGAATNLSVSINSSDKITDPQAIGTINPKTGLLKVTIGKGANAITGVGAVLLNATNAGGYYLNHTEGQALQLGP